MKTIFKYVILLLVVSICIYAGHSNASNNIKPFRKSDKLPVAIINILHDSVKGEVITREKQIPQDLHVIIDSLFDGEDYEFGGKKVDWQCSDCGQKIYFILQKEKYVFIAYLTYGYSDHDCLAIADLTSAHVMLTKYLLLDESGIRYQPIDPKTLISLSEGPWFEKDEERTINISR